MPHNPSPLYFDYLLDALQHGVKTWTVCWLSLEKSNLRPEFSQISDTQLSWFTYMRVVDGRLCPTVIYLHTIVGLTVIITEKLKHC